MNRNKPALSRIVSMTYPSRRSSHSLAAYLKQMLFKLTITRSPVPALLQQAEDALGLAELARAEGLSDE